jgi:hypothetical protein
MGDISGQTVAILPNDADAAAILAYLDTHPDWKLGETVNTMFIYVYSRPGRESFEIVVNQQMATYGLQRVINEINTVALGLPGYVHPAILDRLTTIARLAPADSTIYRIATGQ